MDLSESKVLTDDKMNLTFTLPCGLEMVKNILEMGEIAITNIYLFFSLE